MAIKNYKPTSPGRRGMAVSTYEEITCTKPEKSLLISKGKTGGDFSGKQIVPFATSGGSGLGHTVDDLRASCGPDTCWQPGRLCNGRIEVNALEEWARQF